VAVVGARQADGRHLAVAQLAQDFFPALAVGIEMGEIERGEVQLGARFGPVWQESQ
jgi:hypothetical protein